MVEDDCDLRTSQFCVEVGFNRPNEFVFITGSIIELGCWNPSNALQLIQNSDFPNRWSGIIKTREKATYFRYFIGYYLNTGDQNASSEIVISVWESFITPRFIPVLGSSLPVVNIFGSNGTHRLISDGWLVGDNQSEIIIRIHGRPFKFYKKTNKYKKPSYAIKVTPFDVRSKQEDADEDDMEESTDAMHFPHLPSFSTAQLAILSSAESPLYHEQKQFGEKFVIGESFFMFRTKSVAVDSLGFRLEIFTSASECKTENERFATGFVMPNGMPGTCGVSSITLLANHNNVVGQLVVDYLFIRPLPGNNPSLTFERTFARHWKKRQTLEVGHRGMGNSYTKMAAGRENTISSLNKAAGKGADYVEFDVQLSRDKIAVIFHDFHVLVTVARKISPQLLHPSDDPSSNFHEMAIKELKLKQLQLLRLEHTKVHCKSRPEGATKLTAEADENIEHHPFPTLAQALLQVDPSVGFNIEVKYPMMQKDGSHECENYFEINECVDIILSVVFMHAGDRRILFSSFNPDVCALIISKQQRYPVLFLCVGETTRYVPFVDLRASSSNSAVNFAASLNILGVNFHSEDLLRDPSPVQRAKNFGLVSFVWGDDLNCRPNIDHFKNTLKVDGIIYDRIGEIYGDRRNVFLVEKEEKAALFKQSVSPSESCEALQKLNGV